MYDTILSITSALDIDKLVAANLINKYNATACSLKKYYTRQAERNKVYINVCEGRISVSSKGADTTTVDDYLKNLKNLGVLEGTSEHY